MMGKGVKEVKNYGTNPGLPLSIQRAPRLLLEKSVGPLESLVLSGQLTETKLWLFTGNTLYLGKIDIKDNKDVLKRGSVNHRDHNLFVSPCLILLFYLISYLTIYEAVTTIKYIFTYFF